MLNTGSALIGATAIVTSLVLFAMQVNIERMPHGLFHRLSADPKLIGAFVLAFLLAVGVATLSIFVERGRLAELVLEASWAVIFILLLLMYSYRRALILINPMKQLEILVKDTRRELRLWDRRAQRAMPLFDTDKHSGADSLPSHSMPDLARTRYFQINKHWADGAKRAIRQAMSLARRYAELGDHEVADAALDSVVAINATYINVKGRTFYANSALVENPLTRDGFINDTLECLRQNVERGIANRDEQQIEQTFHGIGALVQIYLRIEYSSPRDPKTHAQLAAGYLAGAVQAVIPHNMADVLMQGLRVLGRSARHLLGNGNPNDIAVVSEKIALIASTGCAKENYRPVTLEGMTQLADLTVDLLRSTRHNIRFASGRIRKDAVFIAKLCLNVPGISLSSAHSTFLGPYYSSTGTDSLKARLTAMVNAIVEAGSDSAEAKAVIRNIDRWADGLYEAEKELLLTAIKARSNFTFDMIHWITGVTELLLATSNAPACDGHTQKELRKHARWLISTLTWIPDDKDTVTFVENFQMTDALFDAAMDARKRGCEGVAREVWQSLRSWTFKGGRYQTGWGILDRGICGLAVLALIDGDDLVSELRTAVASDASGKTAPAQEIRDRAARAIRECAAHPQDHGHWSSGIDLAVAQSDPKKLCALLQEMADLLSLGTGR